MSTTAHPRTFAEELDQTRRKNRRRRLFIWAGAGLMVLALTAAAIAIIITRGEVTGSIGITSETDVEFVQASLANKSPGPHTATVTKSANGKSVAVDILNATPGAWIDVRVTVRRTGADPGMPLRAGGFVYSDETTDSLSGGCGEPVTVNESSPIDMRVQVPANSTATGTFQARPDAGLQIVDDAAPVCTNQ